MTNEVYKHYGYEFSLYSGKTRAYLRYKDIPFEEITTTRQMRREVLSPRTNIDLVPVIVSPDDVAVQDTTEIIDFLEARFPAPSIYPDTPKQKLVAFLLELYGDEFLFFPAMYYRWYFKDENFELLGNEFGANHEPDANEEVRYQIWEKVANHRKDVVLPRLGITQRTHKPIERWYGMFLDHLNGHFMQYPFLLGSRPSVGDFGFMGPLYAHLGRDPYPQKLMQDRAPEVYRWVVRMNNPEPKSGSFLPGDAVPETLYPILRHQFEEHGPLLMDIARHVEAWVREHPGEPIPPMFGEHHFSLGGVKETRVVQAYSQWMLQRALDFYQSLSSSERRTVDPMLEGLGGMELMKFQIPQRISRKDNQLLAEG